MYISARNHVASRKPQKDLSMRRADGEKYAKLIDKLEREIVPNLLTEDADSKERRFNCYENRQHTLWSNYPE
jgi:hypothetical protein